MLLNKKSIVSCMINVFQVRSKILLKPMRRSRSLAWYYVHVNVIY